MDIEEVLGAGDYEEAAFAEPLPISEAFDEPPSAARDTATAPPPEEPDDPSRFILSQYNVFIDMSPFEMALAIFADLTGLSRTDWDRLRQILSLLQCNDQPLQEVIGLP